MDNLQQMIDPDFGLTSKLFSSRIITHDEMEKVKHQFPTTNGRSRLLLELMIEKSNEDRQRFLDCLVKAMQGYIVNYICRNRGKCDL
jgi:hypothetical protein